jgi:hypothetical protein
MVIQMHTVCMQGIIMNDIKTAVFGIYHAQLQAERAIEDLLGAGFSNDDISILAEDHSSRRAFAHEMHTKAPEGASAGAVGGGLIGGTVGLLSALGTLAIPGVGPLLAAGPVLAVLAGMGAGGTVGGLIGGLVGMGIPEYEAKRYEGRIQAGGVLLSVHCGSVTEVTKATDLLGQTGAQDISSAGEASAKYPADRPAALHS